MIYEILTQVVQNSLWLYEFHLREGEEGVVHLPLIYATDVYAELEAYSRAAQRFPQLSELEALFPVRIVDECVFKFPANQYDSFKMNLTDTYLSGQQTGRKLVEEGLHLRTEFPANCLALERKLLAQKPVEKLLASTYDQLVTLISINLANPYFEAAYLYYHHLYNGEALFEELKQKYLTPATFSHLQWYANQTLTLEQTGEGWMDYYWHTAFLRQYTTQDRNPDIIDHIHNLAPASKSWNGNLPLNSWPSPPALTYDSTGITEHLPGQLPDVEYVFFMLRFLQVQEEFRHYWQARFFRWLQLAFPDTEILRTKGIDSLLQQKPQMDKKLPKAEVQFQDFDTIPFGKALIEIARIEAQLSAARSTGATSEQTALLEAELKAAYGLLASQAENKAQNWKQGPILKIKHVDLSELEI